MSNHYVTFDLTTGRIKQYGHILDINLSNRLQAGEGLLEGFGDFATHYVVPNPADPPNYMITDRPTMAISVDKTSVVENEEITITNIPVGTTVYVSGTVVVVNDGQLVLTFDTMGEYHLSFVNFPYQNVEVIINCA